MFWLDCCRTLLRSQLCRRLADAFLRVILAVFPKKRVYTPSKLGVIYQAPKEGVAKKNNLSFPFLFFLFLFFCSFRVCELAPIRGLPSTTSTNGRAREHCTANQSRLKGDQPSLTNVVFASLQYEKPHIPNLFYGWQFREGGIRFITCYSTMQ